MCTYSTQITQGITMDSVAFDTNGINQHGLVYTALSRVKDMNQIYLINKLQHKNFYISSKVSVEIDRLQTKAFLKLEYEFPSIEHKEYYLLCSLNIRSILLHVDNIDYDLMKIDMLCFQETHTKSLPNNNQLEKSYCY